MEAISNNNETNQKFDYKTLSKPKQYVWKICKRILKDLKEDSCTDDEIELILAKVDAKNRGYINPEDYYTADQAAKYLRVTRNTFFDLLKLYKVKCRTVNGRTIGYYRGDIDMILERIIAMKKRRR